LTSGVLKLLGVAQILQEKVL